MRNKKWVRLLAYVTGSVNQELLLQNEYLAAENRILRAKLPSRLRLPDPERATLAEIGKRVGRKALREVARVAKPDTIRPGIGDSSPGSSMASSTVNTLASPRSSLSWKRWWSGWHEKIPDGAMTALWEPWPTWGTDSPIRRWETFCAVTAWLPLPSEARPLRGRTLSPRT